MTAEKALKSYKSWITRKNVLEIQLKNITTTLEKDMIDSMNFFQPYEEFIKTSNISDKTPKIALNYKHMALKESMDSYKYLRSEYINLCNETSFLEFCISKLSGYLPSLIWDMVVENKTWEQVMSKYHISHSMVAKYRKKAIRELNVFYAERDELYFKLKYEPPRKDGSYCFLTLSFIFLQKRCTKWCTKWYTKVH